MNHLGGLRRLAASIASVAVLAPLAAAAAWVPAGPASAQPAPACGEAFPPYAPDPVASSSTTLADQEITMSDGVVLRADVNLPAGIDGPFPTALTITGYNKGAGATAFGSSSSGMWQHGYATITVDDRGTGTSGGQWDSWGERTVEDYTEVLDWVVAQDWSDGTVGLVGTSYMGITSLFAAATGHPSVKAVFATVPMGDSYRDIVLAGGQVNTAFIPLWMGLVTGLGAIPSTDPTTIIDHLLGVPSFQLPTIADTVLGGGPAYDGPFWRQRSPIEVVDEIEAPTFIVGGLDDIFQRGEPMLYEALADHTDARLLIGPWTHITTGQGLPADGVPALGALTLQWFDAHIRGIDTGAECTPPVTQYIRGVDRYEHAPSWPVPDLHAERWHLRGGAGLTPEAPGEGEAARQYLQLPITGLCSRSTNQWLIGIIDSTTCATDNQLDEVASLTYTTAAFAEPVRINGPIQADLWLEAALGSEAVVSVAISSVAPGGQSRGLTNGLLMASHRAVDADRSRFLDGQSIQPWHPFTQAATQPVMPGEPMLLPVEVFPTSAVIPTGHRLRVTIAAYDVPHALPPAPAVVSTLAGPVTVLTDPAHPSSVVLPVIGAQSATVPDAAPDAPAAPAPASPGDQPSPSGRLPATGSGALPGAATGGLALLASLAARALVRRSRGKAA